MTLSGLPRCEDDSHCKYRSEDIEKHNREVEVPPHPSVTSWLSHQSPQAAPAGRRFAFEMRQQRQRGPSSSQQTKLPCSHWDFRERPVGNIPQDLVRWYGHAAGRCPTDLAGREGATAPPLCRSAALPRLCRSGRRARRVCPRRASCLNRRLSERFR